jgi:hypothetical protein
VGDGSLSSTTTLTQKTWRKAADSISGPDQLPGEGAKIGYAGYPQSEIPFHRKALDREHAVVRSASFAFGFHPQFFSAAMLCARICRTVSPLCKSVSLT